MNDEFMLELNDALFGFDEQKHIRQSPAAPELPLVFIVGLPRSGTTLLSQILIRDVGLGYINNFVSRFWKVPATGIHLYNNLCGKITEELPYRSDYGRTDGLAGPHEFGFYWRRWFDYSDSHYVGMVDLDGDIAVQLKRSVASIERALGKPIMFKNLAACGMNAYWLSQIFTNAHFIVCRRNYADVAHSLLEGRKVRAGGVEKWFSVKPPEYEKLMQLQPIDQVIGQIYSIDKHVVDQLSSVDNSRWAVLDYDSLIDHTEDVIEFIKNIYKSCDCELEPAAPDAQPVVAKKNKLKLNDNKSYEELSSKIQLHGGEEAVRKQLQDCGAISVI